MVADRYRQRRHRTRGRHSTNGRSHRHRQLPARNRGHWGIDEGFHRCAFISGHWDLRFRLPDAGYIRRVLACRAAVQQQLANGSFDRVLVSSWSPFAVGLAPLNFLRGVPVDILCHGMDLLKPARSWRYRTVLRRTLRSAATIIANSNFTASVSKNLGAPASRVLVLNPGIDAQRFAPGERPEQLANHLGIGPENRVLLSLSRLVPRKGFDLTLRALPRVLEAHPSTLYVIAGEGPDRRRLEELTASLGLGDHVRFAGPVSAQELPLYYRLIPV